MLKLSNYRKILINQTAFIGDVVLTLPLVYKIKKLNPNSEIHFLTTKISASIPELLKEVHKVITFDKRGVDKGLNGIINLIKILKNENYDLIISPHKSIRTTIINYFAKAKFSISFKKSSLSFLYKKTVNYENNKHEIDRNIALLSVFEEFDNYELDKLKLNFSENTVSKIDKFFLDNALVQFIVVAPGSVWQTKRWIAEYFIDTIKLFLNRGYKVVLTGSKEDKQICEKLSLATNSKNLIDTSGLFSINESVYLISKAELIVTNDSAPIHFAGLTNTKTIAIFGPTIPEFGFSPRGVEDVVIQNEELKCRPCAIHGGNKCPLGTHECMTSITPNLLFEKIKLFL